MRGSRSRGEARGCSLRLAVQLFGLRAGLVIGLGDFGRGVRGGGAGIVLRGGAEFAAQAADQFGSHLGNIHAVGYQEFAA